MSQSPREREPRDINAVIGEMLAWLPADYNAIRASLRGIALTSQCCPPEAMHTLWEQLFAEIANRLPDCWYPDAPDWAVQIGKIVRGEV